MASNCMSHGRKCADTVPSNIGTLGLDVLRAAVLLNPLLEFIDSWVSPLIPIPLSRVDRSSRSRSLSSCVESLGVARTDEKENSGGTGGDIGVLIVGARGCTNVHTGVCVWTGARVWTGGRAWSGVTIVGTQDFT